MTQSDVRGWINPRLSVILTGSRTFPAPCTGAGPHAHRKVGVRDYEVVYIFDSALEESAVNEKLDRYHALVADGSDGQITAVDHWGRRQLAYAIDDHQNGYYVVTHVSTEADRLPEFERLLKLDDDLLRYLVVVNEGDLSTSPAPVVEESSEAENDEER
ncbi:MAG: 30S ribosomal protein S6 [Gemmatimonas sp.]|nr:30S ribosomal protein S6 [Gemmatimonas sp.]